MKLTKRIAATALALLMLGSSLLSSALAAEGDFQISNGELTGYTGPGGDITIPNNVTMIAPGAFMGNIYLDSVTFPEGVKEIGKAAFSGCTEMTEVVIQPGLTTIGSEAFDGCYNLASISIPDSVRTIGSSAFRDCCSLTSLTIPEGITSIEAEAFAACGSLSAFVIPESVTTLGNFAFRACSSLTSMTIPKNVKTIGEEAFLYCSGLTSLVVPAGVTEIGYGAFNGCTSLTVYGQPGSAAETYCKEKGIPFDRMENAPQESSTPPVADTEQPVHEPSEYIYDIVDPGEDLELPTEQLELVRDTASAANAVDVLTSSMTSEQKSSPTGIDLATLYAETAVFKVASKKVSGKEILINKAAVADLEAVAAQTSAAVETALVSGGVTTARLVSNTVTLTTDETGEITIQIDPDILETGVDKIRVETPTYAITLRVADLKEDLSSGIMTITAEDVGSGFAPGGKGKHPTIKAGFSKGRITNPITLSLPGDSGDTTYQAVVKTDGSATSSKYNPATTTMDGKVNTSGSYTVQINQKDFTDISGKSAEMQKAIRYLASKGIVTGTTATEFSPNGSISRAEIAALLTRALGKLDSAATNSFTDVKSSDWYYAAAGSSQKAGLINGYSDGTFQGATTIAKDQILAVAARVLKTEMGYKAPSDPSGFLSQYSDTVAKWAQPEIALATRENLVVRRVDGTFKGESNMTRGDAAIIIYRLFQRIW